MNTFLNFRKVNDLVIADLLVVALLITALASASGLLRTILGLPVALFLPGYTLVASLFPRNGVLSGLERVILSFGMSIAVVPLIALLLNYSPWGISPGSIIWSIAAFVFILSGIAWFSRRRLPRDEQSGIEFDLTFVGRKVVIRDKIVSIILAVAVLGALGMMGYAIVTPNEGQKFTEFYVLGPGGTAADYPKQLKAGEEQSIIPGIVNHEFQQVTYRLVILIDEEKINEVGPIILEHDEKWEQAVNFVPG